MRQLRTIHAIGMNGPDTSPDTKCIYQGNELQKGYNVVGEKQESLKAAWKGAPGPYVMRAEGAPPLGRPQL